ncbi:MAG: CBS domain-containing protein [Erysipelotrichaceae bacterium]|nr:CBS domain-containing protein [Erysipelotrichaceae bacterium]
MFVKDKMTRNPVTISPDDVVSSAVDIFDKCDFHRLPVVDRSNHVVGLITEALVAENVPSKATSLSIHEINYLLNKTTIADIMLKDIATISPDNLLEEAADVMIKSDIFTLPVVDQGFLVGVITQKDIFSAFIEVQGYYNKGTRIVVAIEEDHPGILKDIATILSDENISITHLVVERNGKINIIIRVDETDSDKVADLLKDKYNIIDVKSYK